MAMNGGQWPSTSATTNRIPSATITTAIRRFTSCWPLKTTGALENSRNFFPRLASLPKAMTEPEKVIAPTNVPMNSSTRLPRGIGNGMLNAFGLLTTAHAMRTAARPTSECIAATSSGICVISTRLATYQPTTPPTVRARSAHWTWPVIASVVTTAIAMPAMPNRLPRRAPSGCERPLSARMKRTLATRESRATTLAWLTPPSPRASPSVLSS